MDFSALDRVVLQTLQMPEDAETFYTPVGGGTRRLVDVIFRSPEAPIEGTDLRFEGVGPQFSIHRDDVPELAQGDMLERSGKFYTVKSVSKDEGYLWVAHCRDE